MKPIITSFLSFSVATVTCTALSTVAFANDTQPSEPSTHKQATHIRLATTTSTDNSGLLRYLLPKFEQDSGYKVDVIAAGTGKALKMGENGDVDLVMTHAPKAEATFVEKGYGISPTPLMYNDFVFIGPNDDPAKLKEIKTLQPILEKIAQSGVTFISRGDDSGTHKKELELWAQANIEPNFGGYRSVGQGMGQTINMASELQAYTLTDRATWLAYKDKVNLEIVFQGDINLFNPYQVILINPQRYPTLNHKGATIFRDWLISVKGQELINQYKLSGEQLFVADARTSTAEVVNKK